MARDLVDRHFTHRGTGLEFHMEARWIRGRLPVAGGRALDVGCGVGALFEPLSGFEIVGVDNNIVGLRLTLERFSEVSLAAADAVRLPFGDASFDVVAGQHVIEHLPDAAAACREWSRVLKPGGLLLLLTPNRQFADPSVYDDPTHVHIFERRDLASRLEEAGFEILELRTLGLPWFRKYHGLPGGWRLRRAVIEHARLLSALPGLRWAGQTLCCAAKGGQAYLW